MGRKGIGFAVDRAVQKEDGCGRATKLMDGKFTAVHNKTIHEIELDAQAEVIWKFWPGKLRYSGPKTELTRTVKKMDIFHEGKHVRTTSILNE